MSNIFENLEPPTGIEPATFGFGNQYSSIELWWHWGLVSQAGIEPASSA